MKKSLLTILAFVYLVSSVGATIHLHYCMNKLVAWSFAEKPTDNNTCSYCGMVRPATDKHCIKENRGCCNDEQMQIAIADDQQLTEGGFYLLPIQAAAVTFPVFEHPVGHLHSLHISYPVTNSPPLAGNIPLNIRNCVFRI
jgi:hypothetical protein